MKNATFLFLLFASLSNGQVKYDYNWILGTFDDEGVQVKFEGEEVEFELIEKNIEMAESNVTMSDEDGQLLFYSNGCSIQTKNHSLMENGNGINPGPVHNTFCGGGYNIPQGGLILPAINEGDTYYFFHNRKPTNSSISDVLFLSLIDMTANNGEGEVVEKNIPVLEDSLWQGYLGAVRHANNVDWWVMVPGYYPGQFHKLLLDSSGITLMGEQDMELGFTIGGWGVGQAVFSPDGTKYVHYSNREPKLIVYDFDRESGLMENPEFLMVDDTVFFGGAAISSNNRFLYISNTTKLYQYDLFAPDIQESKTLIDVYDGFVSPFAANFFWMQLAPDCRIYMITGNGTDRLHVIEQPNEKGTACGFRQHAVHLPSSNFHTIPNNPNYRLGTGHPVCDSTIQLVTSTVRVRPPVQQVSVWPNPARGQVQVGLPVPLASGGEWRLYGATGQEVLRHVLASGTTGATVPLAGLAPGLYFWEVTSEGQRVGSGKLVVQQ